jgi:TPR repeat protein
MAHLLGQLRLAPNPTIALPLLRTASDISTIDFPQPAYLYGMLLSNELSLPQPIPPDLILPSSSSSSPSYTAQQSQALEAISRAAYLCHAPAQYQLGFIYEHASLNCSYDPLMSVQWYSLASQGGEVEADMALSKWFLCGAEGHFGKNEKLARTFAEKSARKGHLNGCFAMGYYYE